MHITRLPTVYKGRKSCDVSLGRQICMCSFINLAHSISSYNISQYAVQINHNVELTMNINMEIPDRYCPVTDTIKFHQIGCQHPEQCCHKKRKAALTCDIPLRTENREKRIWSCR